MGRWKVKVEVSEVKFRIQLGLFEAVRNEGKYFTIGLLLQIIKFNLVLKKEKEKAEGTLGCVGRRKYDKENRIKVRREL